MPISRRTRVPPHRGKNRNRLGVNPPSRFGELKLDRDQVIDFAEKPEFADSWINGGYFFFRRDIKLP